MSPIIEEVFLRCFGTPQRLCEYINSDINLAEYVKDKYRAYISLIWLCLGKKAAILEEVKQITPDDVHNLLKRRRPDLSAILENEKAKKWFYKQNFADFLKL